MSIVTLTMNPTIDASTSASQVIAERKIRCQEPVHEPGGGGINVSRAIKKLGGTSLACFTMGGTNGDLLLQLLKAEKIDTREIHIEEMTRLNTTVLEIQSNRQFRLVMPGPTLKQDEWQACLNAIEEIDPPPAYVAASGSLPRGVPADFYARLCHITERRGSRLIVDTSGAPLHEVLHMPVFMIKPNVRELTELMDVDDSGSETEIEQAARSLMQECGCRHIIISLGSGGALVLTKESTRHLRAPTVPIKSKVGAGDSMVAGIVLRLDSGDSLHDAVAYGVAAGASAVMTPGTALCQRDSTERLYEQLRREA